MYKGPDCIAHIYGGKLKPLTPTTTVPGNANLTSIIHASGRSIGTPRESTPSSAPPARSKTLSPCVRRGNFATSFEYNQPGYSPAATFVRSTGHKSLNSNAGVQNGQQMEKLQFEIQRLQKTLSDKEDLILTTRRIAAEKEKKLKAELAEASERCTEVTGDNERMKKELEILKESTVDKEEHSKLITQYTKTEALMFDLQSKLVGSTATVPLEEYRMLQRELEECSDEVIQYREIAQKKEKELEAVILSQADRIQALKMEYMKEKEEEKRMMEKQIQERDSRIRMFKEQITTSIGEKSIARQEQLKELSRDLDLQTQENKHLKKKLQEFSSRQQHCDTCDKYRRQIKALQEGKRIVDLNVLKPIKGNLDHPVTLELTERDMMALDGDVLMDSGSAVGTWPTLTEKSIPTTGVGTPTRYQARRDPVEAETDTKRVPEDDGDMFFDAVDDLGGGEDDRVRVTLLDAQTQQNLDKESSGLQSRLSQSIQEAPKLVIDTIKGFIEGRIEEIQEEIKSATTKDKDGVDGEEDKEVEEDQTNGQPPGSPAVPIATTNSATTDSSCTSSSTATTTHTSSSSQTRSSISIDTSRCSICQKYYQLHQFEDHQYHDSSVSSSTYQNNFMLQNSFVRREDNPIFKRDPGRSSRWRDRAGTGDHEVLPHTNSFKPPRTTSDLPPRVPEKAPCILNKAYITPQEHGHNQAPLIPRNKPPLPPTADAPTADAPTEPQGVPPPLPPPVLLPPFPPVPLPPPSVEQEEAMLEDLEGYLEELHETIDQSNFKSYSSAKKDDNTEASNSVESPHRRLPSPDDKNPSEKDTATPVDNFSIYGTLTIASGDSSSSYGLTP